METSPFISLLRKSKNAVSALRNIWRELTHPRVEEQKRARQEYMTRVVFTLVSISLFIMTLIVLLFSYGAGEQDHFPVIVISIMDGLVLGGWVLLNKNHWQVSRYILPAMFLLYAGYMFITIGIFTSAVLQLAIAVLLANMLFGNRASWIMVIASLVIYLGGGWLSGEREIEIFLIGGVIVGVSLSSIALLESFFSNLLNRSLSMAHKREAKLRSIFLAAPIGIGLVINRVIQETNDTLCQMIGYSRQELVGKSARMLYPSQEEFEYVGTEKYRQINEKEIGTVETRWQRKDGEIRDILLSSAPLVPGDLSKGVTFSALDITERKRAEQALLESEERYRQAVENSPNPIFSVDRAGNIQTWNRACEKILQYGQEVIGEHFRKLLQTTEDEPAVKSMLDKVSCGQSLSDIDMVYHSRDGSERLMVSRIYPLLDQEGIAQGFVFANTDMTERKRSALALQEREAKLQSIFRSAPIGIGMVVSQVIQEVNPTLCQMTGYSRKELIGQRSRILYPAQEDYDFVASEKYRESQRGEVVTVETRWQLKNGEMRDILLSSVPLDPGDLSKGVTFSALDITERKQAETEQRALLKEKEILLAEVHHRVKNNMQIINSLLSLQAEDVTDVSTLKLLEESRSRIQSMSLVHELLYRSGEYASIDFAGYVNQLASTLFRLYQVDFETVCFTVDSKNIKLDLVRAIPCGLLLNEIITNSLKYAFPEGRKGNVWVNIQSGDGKITIDVGDDGIGFPPGFDIQTSKTLGLQLVNLLVVHDLQGRISCEAKTGTQFHIEFPTRQKEKQFS